MANSLVDINEHSVRAMTENNDFSPVEGREPELLSFFLQAAPSVLKAGLSVAMENEKIRANASKYIHLITQEAIANNTALLKSEQEYHAESYKYLGQSLNDISKKDVYTAEDIEMFFALLQTMEQKDKRMAEITKQGESFIDIARNHEIDRVQPKKSSILGAVAKVAQSPKGIKLLASLAHDLYRLFTK